ncbi:MAG: NAD(P)-dependent oxidoreductase [Candidatus Shapirobacteria bacterium]|jgi:D-lactate dehydrogenase
MTDYKIAFFGVKSWERAIIEKEIINLDACGVGIFEDEVQDNIEMAKKYEILSVFIYSKMNKEVLDRLPSLKMITTRSTGVDHIDSGECKKRKIEVMSVPVYGSNTVAEYAFALILAVAKNIVEAHQAVEDDEFSPEGLTGIDLFGKTLGIVGLGKIGANVAKMAKAFGMKIIAVEKFPDEKIVKKYKVKLVDLETLLKEADVVTLHLPAMKETYHLINRENIKLMKTGSILVNTSRGAVVETEAIIWALDKGILRGAGLDVVEEEDKIESMSMVMSQRPSKDDLQNVLSYHMLRDRDDVVFTPHNAFNTEEAIERIIKTTIENIKNFCNNRV